MRFSSGTRAFTLSGAGTLTLGASGVVNQSATAQAVSAPLKLGAAAPFTVSSTGALNIIGTVDTNAFALTLNGAGTGGGTLSLANDTGLAFGRNTTISATSTVASDLLSSGTGITHTLGTLGIAAVTLTANASNNVTSGTAGVTFGATTLTGTAIISPSANTQLTPGSITSTNPGATIAGNLALTGLHTFTGQTLVQAGTLTFDTLANVNAGSSALGNPADATAGTIKLVNTTTAATIAYTGTGHTSGRALDLARTTGGAASISAPTAPRNPGPARSPSSTTPSA